VYEKRHSGADLRISHVALVFNFFSALSYDSVTTALFYTFSRGRKFTILATLYIKYESLYPISRVSLNEMLTFNFGTTGGIAVSKIMLQSAMLY
jgi:hypothetical protein